jgi:hypothetical protein
MFESCINLFLNDSQHQKLIMNTYVIKVMNVENHHCLLSISCISMVHNTSLCAFYMQDKDEQFHNCAQVATWMLILLKKEWCLNIIFISNDTF